MLLIKILDIFEGELDTPDRECYTIDSDIPLCYYKGHKWHSLSPKRMQTICGEQIAMNFGDCNPSD